GVGTCNRHITSEVCITALQCARNCNCPARRLQAPRSQQPTNDHGFSKRKRPRILASQSNQLADIGEAQTEAAELFCHHRIEEACLLKSTPQRLGGLACLYFSDCIRRALLGEQSID